MPRRWALAGTAWLCAFPWAVQAADLDLRPRFIPGASVHYVSRADIELRTRVDLADLDERAKVRLESGMTLTVADSDSNGHAHVLWTTHYIHVKSDRPLPGLNAPLDYDSRNPAGGSPLAPLLGQLVGKPFRVRLDPAGRIIDGPEGLPGVSDSRLATVAASFFFSREAFAQLPLFVTQDAPYPAQIRESWSRTTVFALPLGAASLHLDQQFTIPRISPRRKWAFIQMTGKVTGGTGWGTPANCPPPDDCPPSIAPLIIKDGRATGTYTWDYENGRLEEAEGYLEFGATLTSVLGPMELTQKMHSSVQRTTAKAAGALAEEPPREKSPAPSPHATK